MLVDLKHPVASLPIRPCHLHLVCFIIHLLIVLDKRQNKLETKSKRSQLSSRMKFRKQHAKMTYQKPTPRHKQKISKSNANKLIKVSKIGFKVDRRPQKVYVQSTKPLQQSSSRTKYALLN